MSIFHGLLSVTLAPDFYPVLSRVRPIRRRKYEEVEVTEEQIIGVLREQEAGMKTADLGRKHGISPATFYQWKAKFGGLEVSEARRLRTL